MLAKQGARACLPTPVAAPPPDSAVQPWPHPPSKSPA
jgi:hypothetical protein